METTIEIIAYSVLVVVYLGIGYFIAWLLHKLPRRCELHLDSENTENVVLLMLLWPAVIVCAIAVLAAAVCIGGPIAIFFWVVEKLTKHWED